MITVSSLLWLYIHLKIKLLYMPSSQMEFSGITSISYSESPNQQLNQFLKYGIQTPSDDQPNGAEVIFKYRF